jgi:DNA-binding MarR family transcriptional regulator
MAHDPAAPPFTHAELAAWRGLLETHARITAQLDAEMRAAHGLSVSAYEVLMFLADAPDHRLRMSQIAADVLLSRSGCTRLVDRLVALGLVTRSAADGDGRGLYATLTAQGNERLGAARATHRAGVRRLFLDRLGAEDQRALAGVWRALGGPAAGPGSA